ncbi:MAG: hypothetical protein ACRCX5_14355 [Bacteroidales bacterium]|uniref:hypothetical protein n=1 Tax=Clostridium chrysemydis TaxID=2665504 RepID=UPI003F369D5D
MKEEQQKAINSVNRALKKLHKSGVIICAMDNSILYATEKRVEECTAKIKELERRMGGHGANGSVAETYKIDDTHEDVGILYSKGFGGAGGW